MRKLPILPSLICVLAFVAAILFAFRFTIFGNHDELRNADSAPWLPGEASQIYSSNQGWLEEYEFSISEQGFLKWAGEKGLEVSRIEGEPIRIGRYLTLDQSEKEGVDCYSGDGERLTSDAAKGVWKCIDDEGVHVASQGYHGERRRLHHGGYSVVFDSEENRAYYSWSAH